MTRAVVTLAVLAVVTLAAASRAGAVPGPMLSVESLRGAVRLQRAGATQSLSAGAELREGDALSASGEARFSLRFARHGVFELGPGAEISVERLPFASFADDLRSVFRLRRGYLRVIWKQPSLGTDWPLFIYAGAYRAGLGSGEYFFEKYDEDQSVCAAEGELALATTGQAETQVLEPANCYRLIAGLPPQAVPQSFESWVAVRQQRRLADVMAAAVPPQRLPAPAAPRPAPAPLPLAQPVPLPPPEPVPAAAPPPPKPPGAAVSTAAAAVRGSGGWTLNLASFPQEATARQQVERLRQAGYPAVVQVAEVKGRTWYRVQIPALASAEAARRLSGEVRTLGFAQAWIVRTP